MTYTDTLSLPSNKSTENKQPISKQHPRWGKLSALGNYSCIMRRVINHNQVTCYSLSRPWVPPLTVYTILPAGGAA
jgi:hypothetical protein